MRALLAIHEKMRDEFDEAIFIAGVALFGRQNVEPEPLRLRGSVSDGLPVEIEA